MIMESKLLHFRTFKKMNPSPGANVDNVSDTNNSNRRSALRGTTNRFLIDTKFSENVFESNNIVTYFNSVNDINEKERKKERKINRLYKGLPTALAQFDCSTFNSNNSESEARAASFEYSFYSYFFPSESDEGLIPFLDHFENADIVQRSKDDDFFLTERRGDRRLKMVENKCKVRIKISNLEEKLIKGLPRRKVTVVAKKPEHVATALSCMEDSIPELFINAIFLTPLDCKTQKWPNSKGLLLRHIKKSTHFHKRSYNCPLNGSIWDKSIDPRRVFPFSSLRPKIEDIGVLHTNVSNTVNAVIYPVVTELTDVTEQTTKFASSLVLKQSISKKDYVLIEKNNNYFGDNTPLLNNDLVKYLKFPNCKESNQLFAYDNVGQPVNSKFLDYLRLCQCRVENIKCRFDKFGVVYYGVKIRYQQPSQLVKLFLLLKFKIKY